MPSVAAGESVVFNLASMARNCFLQPAAGLLGGDDWALGTYTATDDHYRRSEVYSRTVTQWRDGTDARLYQRNPLACWYAMGSAVVVGTDTSTLTVRLQWTAALSDNLWCSARIPNQVATLVTPDGRLAHAPIQADATTATTLVVTWPSASSSAGNVPTVGTTVRYMLRPRAPNVSLVGTVQVTDASTGDTVRLQASPEAIPTSYRALLYLGGRGAHPTNTCAMQDPSVARNNVYAVVSVTDVGATSSLHAVALQPPTLEAWLQPSPHLAIGRVGLPDPARLTGYTYTWPYPADQPGTVWLLVPTGAPPPATVAGTPGVVCFVRAAEVATQSTPSATGVVDGVTLGDGERVLTLRLDPSTGAVECPVDVFEWDAGTRTYTRLDPAAWPIDSAGTGALLVVEGGATYADRAWWRLVATDTTTTAATALIPYAVGHHRDHDGSTVGVVDLTNVSGALAATVENHVLLLLRRSSDNRYAPQPATVSTNLYASHMAWTFPVDTASGADRLVPAALTDGRLGPLVRYDASYPDRTAVRRVMAARPETVTTVAPEYVRINMDMGSPVVMHDLVWAVAALDMYPTLTVHASNDPAFMGSTAVTVARGLSGAVFSYNTHTPLPATAAATLLWQLTWTGGGSRWTAAEVTAGTADVYYTRLTSGPRYSRLYAADGTAAVYDFTGFANGAHVIPTVDLVSLAAYRYYALTVSIGRFGGGVTERHTLEIQQWQPVVEAPVPSPLPATGAAVLYGRVGWEAWQRRFPARANDRVLEVVLSKAATGASTGGTYGYAEVWSEYRNRLYYRLWTEWSPSAYPVESGFQGNSTRRALLTIPEVLVPRKVWMTSRNAPITTVPFVWCYVRQRSVRPVEDQSVITHRSVDGTVASRSASALGSSSASSSPSTTIVAPPAWIYQRDTLRFMFNIGSARIPGESVFVSLTSDVAVTVDVIDAPRSSLPELCFTLPSGEVLDFDGVYATVRVQMIEEEPTPKRSRTS